MTTRIIVDALRDYFEANAPAELAAITQWMVEETGEDKTYPRVVFEETAADEHEIMRGNYDPLTVEVTMTTNPEDDDEGAHAILADALYELAGDTDPITTDLNGKANIQCYDTRLASMRTEPEAGFRVSTFELNLCAALQQ